MIYINAKNEMKKKVEDLNCSYDYVKCCYITNGGITSKEFYSIWKLYDEQEIFIYSDSIHKSNKETSGFIELDKNSEWLFKRIEYTELSEKLYILKLKEKNKIL